MNRIGHAIITGATGGIGAATAQELAAAGFALTLVARDPERLARLGSSLRQAGCQVAEIAAELGMGTDFGALVSDAEIRNGPIDVLINNAAVNWFGHFDGMPASEIDRLIATDIGVPIRLSQAVLRSMQTRDRGLIVNIGSAFGSIGCAGFTVYSACKFALRGFSESLRRELRDTGIGVVYVAPRYTRTEFNAGAVARMAAATGMTQDDPARVARYVADAIARRRPETIIGWPERLYAKLNAVLPRLIDRGMAAQTRTILAMAPGNRSHLTEEIF